MEVLWGPAAGGLPLGPRLRVPSSSSSVAELADGVVGVGDPHDAAGRAAAAAAAAAGSAAALGGSSSASLGYRVLAFALLGLAMNIHGATRGRREWVLRYDGTFARAQTHRMTRATGLTVTLGLDTLHACASAVSCTLLLAACLTARRWLSLPALLLTASDLLGDVSDAVVATALLLVHSGVGPALSYAFFATLVIAFELYLWVGVLRWYEQGLVAAAKQAELQRRERLSPSTASSVSSVMD